MARFDLHAMPGGKAEGYLVNVQAELLTVITTRVVLPLLPADAARSATQLNPVFEIDGKNHVLVTQAISAVSTAELKKVVGSLAGGRDEITRALDLLLTGF